MTQEFHISVTPVGKDEYLVRTERVAPGVPLAEEQLLWSVEDWLMQARQLMNDPLMGLLQGDRVNRIAGFEHFPPHSLSLDPEAAQLSLSFIELGQVLYQNLFQGTLRDSWMTARGIAQHRGEVLRLRLGLKGTKLPRLPWEVLHMGDSSIDRHRPVPRPIATGTDVIFSRYQPNTRMATPRLTGEAEQPLRILMVVAAPTDQERLDLKREAQQLQQELRHTHSLVPGGVAGQVPELQLTVLDQPGREQLTQALEQGQYQVLHYAGHSNLGAAGGNLYLVNPRTGLTEILSGDDLAGLLVNNGIRMAVFNSCRGAYTAAAGADLSEERNLAEALISRGVPAVLAMAEQIPDDVALTLTRLFYRNLKQGYPIDLSLSRARQGLISAYGSHQLYWALPILYLHPECDGYLTGGDRTFNNPADRLLVQPQVYDLSPSDEGRLEGRTPSVPIGTASGTASVIDPAIDPADDWAMIADSILADDEIPDEDLADLMGDLEYEDSFGELSDEEDLSAEDASVVAALIQQLSQPLVEPEQGPPDPDVETLWLAGDEMGGEADLPLSEENPPYHHPSAPRPASAARSKTGALSAMATDAATAHPYQGSTPAGWQVNPSGVVASASPGWLRPLWQDRQSRPRLLLAGVAGGAAIALVGMLVWQNLQQPRPADLLRTIDNLPGIQQGATAPPLDVSAVDLNATDASTLTAIAIAHFSKGELAAGQLATAALLDQQALPQANAALATVPAEQLDDPGISFLRGRLAWQSVKSGNTDYSIDDARRYWETAVRQAPDLAEYHNALGFAYYAEGNLREALDSWQTVLSLPEGELSAVRGASNTGTVLSSAQSSSDSTALTAYAGIALALQQAATDPNFGDPADLRSKAAKTHQMVLSNDPLTFQPQALAANWLWTESAIANWQTLATL